jgi:Cdc6-like AAA superfamily ATPase
LTDYSDQQRDFIATRQISTGEWLLNSEEFQTWLHKEKSTLYCPGIPGSGKTIMSSIVVNHLLARYQDNSKIGVVYLYCNYRQQQEQNLENLLSNILKQLQQKQQVQYGKVLMTISISVSGPEQLLL